MQDYTGIACPVCGQIFNQGDDIVVCPDCGTPHHRSCYAELGQCVHQNQHSEGFLFVPEYLGEDPKETFACMRCGTMNNPENTHCKNCGYPLRNDNQENLGSYMEQQKNNLLNQYGLNDPSHEVFENVTVSDLTNYIGPSNLPYTFRFIRMSQTKKSSFNFFAFLFSGFYYLYRRLYKLGFLLLLLKAAACFAALYFSTPYMLDFFKTGEMLTSGTNYLVYTRANEIYNIFSVFLNCLAGFFFNRLYMRATLKRIREVKEKENYSTGIGSELPGLLTRKGGVDKIVVVVAGILSIAAYFAYVYLFIMTKL